METNASHESSHEWANIKKFATKKIAMKKVYSLASDGSQTNECSSLIEFANVENMRAEIF